MMHVSMTAVPAQVAWSCILVCYTALGEMVNGWIPPIEIEYQSYQSRLATGNCQILAARLSQTRLFLERAQGIWELWQLRYASCMLWSLNADIHQ
jgi:hypothetical protein